jgi:hypothetical protein
LSTWGGFRLWGGGAGRRRASLQESCLCATIQAGLPVTDFDKDVFLVL